MTKKDETTSRLDLILENIDTDCEAEHYINDHADDTWDSFHEYLNDYVAGSGINMTEVIRRSRINKNYVYGIVNGTKQNPGHDKMIALCIAAGMSLSETNRALKIAKQGILYSKDERDIRISICINRGITDITNVNLYLEENGVAILEV